MTNRQSPVVIGQYIEVVFPSASGFIYEPGVVTSIEYDGKYMRVKLDNYPDCGYGTGTSGEGFTWKRVDTSAYDAIKKLNAGV
jgi:hypothetical protein